MATATRSRNQMTASTDAGWQPYRLTVRQYLAMIDAGIFPHDARVELLDGSLVDPMTKYPPHNYTARQMGILLKQLVPENWLLSEEKSLTMGRFWRPEPDLAVIRGPNDRYRKRDPAAADVSLLIEVADSSYATDRGRKWQAYASARIPIYWIVNLAKSQVEVYREPKGRGKKASYRATEIFAAGDGVPVVIDGQDVGRISVNEILP
jgi:Uma2 family endonuclease